MLTSMVGQQITRDGVYSVSNWQMWINLQADAFTRTSRYKLLDQVSREKKTQTSATESFMLEVGDDKKCIMLENPLS